MSIWSENYHFIKEVYDFRLEEMNKWMDALEESSKKLITNKVYTSREFRRMRDQFRYQCKNLKREELKQWLHDMLKLLNQKSDQNLEAEKKRLESMIQRHAEMLPGVQENIRKVDVYSKCYQYVDDITPLVKLLEELRRKSSEDAYEGKKSQGAANSTKIHPDSTEQVASFIESQEANIAKIEEKRSEFTQLIKRGDKLGTQPDCPDFLKERVKSLSELFQETEVKAKHKLSVLKVNEKAWQEYDDGSLLMTNLLDQADEKLRNIRKMYDPKAGAEDLAVRCETAKKTRDANETCMTKLKESVAIIYKICSPDKKTEVERAMNVFEERSKVLEKTDSRIKYLTEYTEDLQKYCNTIDETLSWLDVGQKELEELMKFPGEDKSDEKLLMTVKMQKHMETKLAVLQHLVSEQERLLAGKSNMTVEGYMRDVDHIRVKLDELNTKLKEVSGEISEDLHHWADYQAELKVFRPWLDEVEQRIKAGLKKPASLSEAEQLFISIKAFDTDIRDRDNGLSKMRETVSKMTQHGRADKEIEECSKRRLDSETVSTEWLDRVEKLVKQWEELSSTVTEVQDWVAATEKKKDIPDKDEVDTTLNKLKSFFVAKEELVAAL